jgi:hypothetical protein
MRRKAGQEFHQICIEGSKKREKQGVSVEEVDRILEHSIQAGNSRKTK